MYYLNYLYYLFIYRDYRIKTLYRLNIRIELNIINTHQIWEDKEYLYFDNTILCAVFHLGIK